MAGKLAELDKKHIGYNEDIQRYKGLGEMDADQLADTTMDPRTRMLRRIRMEDAATGQSDIFSLLMGDDVPPRKAVHRGERRRFRPFQDRHLILHGDCDWRVLRYGGVPLFVYAR